MFQTAAITSSSHRRPPTSLHHHRHPRMRQVCLILLRTMVQLNPTLVPNPGLTPPYHRQPPAISLLHLPITSPPPRLTVAQLPFVRFLHSQCTFQTLTEHLQHRDQVRTSSKLLRPPHPCQCTTLPPHSRIPSPMPDHTHWKAFQSTKDHHCPKYCHNHPKNHQSVRKIDHL